MGLRFRAKIQDHGRGTWGYLQVPRTQSVKVGGLARVPVRGTVNRVPIQTSRLPVGDGSFTMVVNAQVRWAAGVRVGGRVEVRLEVDRTYRTVSVPADLRRALARSLPAREQFSRLPNSHRRRYAEWLSSAKRPETRRRRLAEVVARLRRGERLPR